MIYKSPQESARLLADRLNQENFTDIFLTYINPDAKAYCQLFANLVSLPLHFLETTVLHNSGIKPHHIVIIDDGSLRAGEYVEFTDYLHHHFPETNIILTIPFVPTSEEQQFQQISDSLITLQVEPLFFSVNQFYENPGL